MDVNSTSFLASLLYLVGAFLQYLNLSRKLTINKAKLFVIGMLGVMLHTYVLYRWIDTPLGQNLSISHMFSLICWLITLTTLAVGLMKPIEHLSIFIFPAATLSIVLAIIFPGQDLFQTNLHPSSLVHILLSVFAFGILGMAGLQATLIYCQNRLLRNKSVNILIWILPPLQTMETMFFQMMWFGFLLLTASLTSAFLFLDELFVVSRLQKVLLSLFTWGLFAVLLYRHHHSGLRGLKATQWTLMGLGLLIIAYLGNKLFYTIT